MASQAFVSLATNDDYAMGALALGRSLRDANTSKTLVLLVTNGVSPHARDLLRSLWDELVYIEELDSRDWEHLQLLNRPELGVTFTKLHAWRLVRFQKCVFLDADTLVLCNVDELFEREEFSAAPDVGWPDCFNSGVFVYRPSLETFANLYQLATTEGSFDGGDQGLLNTYWSDWATRDIKYHLPFVYNVTPNMYYQYAPAYKRFGKNARIVHFLGPMKPWHHTYLPESDSVIPIPHSAYQHSPEHLLRWWRAYQATQPQPRYPTPVSPSPATGGDPMDGAGHDDHVHHPHHDQHHAPPVHHDQNQGPPIHHGQNQGPPPIHHDQHRDHHHHHRSSPVPRHHHHHGHSHHRQPPTRTRSPTPRHTTHSPVPQGGARSTTPEFTGGHGGRRSNSREASLEPPMIRRRRAWQKGEIDYLGADSFETFIGPVLVSDPNRRNVWERGEIDYLGEDSYETLIGHLIHNTLNMYVMDEDKDDKDGQPEHDKGDEDDEDNEGDENDDEDGEDEASGGDNDDEDDNNNDEDQDDNNNDEDQDDNNNDEDQDDNNNDEDQDDNDNDEDQDDNNNDQDQDDNDDDNVQSADW